MHSLQTLYDERRECEATIEDAKRAKKRKREIDQEVKKQEIDLVKSKQLTWTQLTFEDWFTNNDEEESEYWVCCTDMGPDFGVWRGLDNLNSNERAHFDTFVNDYFYYGGPNYMDNNAPNAELSECQLAFESGDCRVVHLYRHEL
jgi:hypothetical protein